MTILEGTYYDGRTPIAVPAKMEITDGSALLTAGQTILQHEIALLKVSPRIAKSDRFIALPEGAQFQCTDHPILQSLPQTSPSEGPVAWLEERWGVALAGILIIASLLIAGYFYGLPVAAERVAARIPIDTEKKLGKHAIAWLDDQQWFKPTNLDLNAQKSIRDGFDRLRNDLPLKEHYQLEFRASKVFGENAFAFPGGTIVITDGMVKLANSDEEIFAVLAHEMGHQELRHTMRSLLQNSVVAVAAAAVTSDAASLSAAVAGIPVLLAQTKYSREFEAAADEYAFELLKRKGYSTLAFASIMERLAEKHKTEERTFAYISTHPITEERVQRARNAAGSIPEDSVSDNIKSSYNTSSRRENYEAIRLYTEALTSGHLSPGKQAITYNDRGSAWMSAKGYANAVADYTEAVRLNPQFAMAFFNRGVAYFHEQQFTLAAADFKQSWQLKADTYTSLWLYLARTRNGDSDAQMELTANEYGTKSDWPTPLVMFYLGKSSPASVTAAALNTDPKTHSEQMCEANFYMGEWYSIKGYKKNASALLSKAKSECPTNNLERNSSLVELERLR